MRSKLFILVDRIFHLILKVLKAVHQGFWLGIMGREQFWQIANLQYGTWPRYRSDEHNLSGLFEWEEKIVHENFGACSSLLVGAAGGGREVIALSKKGYSVVGFECQPDLAQCAKSLITRLGIDAIILDSNVDSVPSNLGLFDGLILGWGAYIHIPGREARISFLKEFRECLRPGGPLLISFFVRKSNSRSMLWIYGIATLIRRIRLSSEVVEIGDTLEGTFDHYFERSELETELKLAGFVLARYHDIPFGHAIATRTVN
jgi:hypothetical protein